MFLTLCVTVLLLCPSFLFCVYLPRPFRGRKIWKKQIWPWLEPLIGVPDERAAAKQKRQDAADAKQRRRDQERATGGGGSGTRKKNTEFRDDEES